MDDPCAGHSHDHDHTEDEQGLSLRPQIDLPRVECLNEEVRNSGRDVLKIHEERMSVTPSLRSPEDDPELLLHIPFTEAVSVHSISIRSVTSEETAPPRRIKLYADRENLDFETARDLRPQMTLELVPPDHFVEGTIDYPCRPAGRFQNISHLSIFVENNFDPEGELPTEITYVGLKGRGSRMVRRCVEAVYESRGMMKDHKVPDGELGGRNLI